MSRRNRIPDVPADAPPDDDLLLAAETLTGDLRDVILDRLRHEQDKRPWHERSEADQRATVAAIEAAALGWVTKALTTIAARGHAPISATLAQVTIKEGIKAVVEMSRFDEQRHALADAQGKTVLILVADPAEFEGERAPVPIRPDQGDLTMAGGF